MAKMRINGGDKRGGRLEQKRSKNREKLVFLGGALKRRNLFRPSRFQETRRIFRF